MALCCSRLDSISLQCKAYTKLRYNHRSCHSILKRIVAFQRMGVRTWNLRWYGGDFYLLYSVGKWRDVSLGHRFLQEKLWEEGVDVVGEGVVRGELSERGYLILGTTWAKERPERFRCIFSYSFEKTRWMIFECQFNVYFEANNSSDLRITKKILMADPTKVGPYLPPQNWVLHSWIREFSFWLRMLDNEKKMHAENMLPCGLCLRFSSSLSWSSLPAVSLFSARLRRVFPSLTSFLKAAVKERKQIHKNGDGPS